MSAVQLDLETPAGPAHIALSRPRSPIALLVLTHGASGGVETRDVLAVQDASLTTSIAVALVTQPFRVAGRRSPPAPDPQDAAWIAAVAALRRRRGLSALPLFLGGRSNGARVACRTATALHAAGVVALAFPLHPPGRPDRSLLPELELPAVPVLVVQGDRDPFGLPPGAPGRTVQIVPGADHGLRRDLAGIAEIVVRFVTSTVSGATV